MKVFSILISLVVVLAILSAGFFYWKSGTRNQAKRTQEDKIRSAEKETKKSPSGGFVDTKSPHQKITKVSEVWKFHSYAFEIPKKQGSHMGLVAPEVIKMGKVYRMFIAANIGTRESLEDGIASFVSNDLENWTYEGIVVESYDQGKTFSGPNLVAFLDENGENMCGSNPPGCLGDMDYDGYKYMWLGPEIEKDRLIFKRFIREEQK